MSPMVSTHVRLPVDIDQRIRIYARQSGKSPSAVIRDGVTFFLNNVGVVNEAERRSRQASEFVFLALDTIIATEYPDDHKELLTEADKRAGELHVEA